VRKLNHASKLSHASSTTDINATKQEKLVEHTSSPEDRENVKLRVATSLILSRKDNKYIYIYITYLLFHLAYQMALQVHSEYTKTTQNII
jgi:hypothetical protein